MKILITNDDGVEAKGIKALTKSLRTLKGVEVIVVAPEREKSATSHALTLHRPLRLIKKGSGVFAVDGTPTDSVMLGCAVALKGQKPDLIVSGINAGGNLGDDIHYSGTVSAAIEGGIMGIPAIAISQLGRGRFDFSQSAKFAQVLVAAVKRNGLPRGIVLNVNVPVNCQQLNFELTKLGKRDYGDITVEKIDPRGRPYYWIGGNHYAFQDIAGSDCNAIVAGKISVTPLNVNTTDPRFLNEMKKWKW
jgi:5'-nucleotidase